MKDKKKAAGAGIGLAVIGLALAASLGAKKEEAPPLEEREKVIPLLAPPTVDPEVIYTPTPPDIVRAAAAVSPEAVTTLIEIEAERQRQAIGITEEEVETYQDFALRINTELGGSYVGGMLTAPSSWTGSVTEWSRRVQQVAAERWS